MSASTTDNYRPRSIAGDGAHLGDFARIDVRDEGVGISKDQLHHIFDPFFTTKEVGEGTGLGLSIAYGIVEDHGGWIEVESVVGKGSRFSVFLPLVAETAERTPPVQPAASLPEDVVVNAALCREYMNESYPRPAAGLGIVRSGDFDDAGPHGAYWR